MSERPVVFRPTTYYLGPNVMKPLCVADGSVNFPSDIQGVIEPFEFVAMQSAFIGSYSSRVHFISNAHTLQIGQPASSRTGKLLNMYNGDTVTPTSHIAFHIFALLHQIGPALDLICATPLFLFRGQFYFSVLFISTLNRLHLALLFRDAIATVV